MMNLIELVWNTVSLGRSIESESRGNRAHYFAWLVCALVVLSIWQLM